MSPAIDPLQGDAVTFLKHQHNEVKGLFAEFDMATNPESKRDIVAKLMEMLSQHEEAEEQKFWPLFRKEVPGGDAIVDRLLEQEHKGKTILAEIDKMSPQNTQLEMKMQMLKQGVLEHAATEETEAFPKAQATFGSERLMKLGQDLRDAEKMAPTRPHPNAPPGNPVAGMGARVVDEVRDAMGQGIKGKNS